MNDAVHPPMTVIIPTRDRAGTLRDTIRTCVAQDYGKLQIIVSDNCSKDNTAEVVRSFNDPRIRYIKTNIRLSMSKNWEFALSHAKEGFVTIIGDDDGLMPGSVTDAAQVLVKTGQKALAWCKAEYHWPDHPSFAIRNKLLVPPDNVLILMKANHALRDAGSLILPYNKLPTLYNSFVSVPVIESVKRRTGVFFNSVTPDIYSGFALLSVLDSYLYSSRPFSINGASGRSNGSTALFSQKVEGEMLHFLLENDIEQNDQIQVIPGAVYSSLGEAMLQASRYCFDGRLELSRRRLLKLIARDVARLSEERKRDASRDLFRMADRLGHRKAIEKYLNSLSVDKGNELRPDLKQCGIFERGQIRFWGHRHGISNVADAAQFVGEMLNPYSLPGRVLPYSRRTLVLTERMCDFHILARMEAVRESIAVWIRSLLVKLSPLKTGIPG